MRRLLPQLIYITPWLQRVLAQTFSDYEYNCSTDNTLEIVRRYESKDHRIRVHNNSDFFGVVENHNLAFCLVSPAAKFISLRSGELAMKLDEVAFSSILHNVTTVDSQSYLAERRDEQIFGQYSRPAECAACLS